MPVGKKGGSAPGERRGGRKVGSPSAAQTALEQLLKDTMGDKYISPPRFMAAVMAGLDPATYQPDPEVELEHKIRCADSLAKLTYPTLKSVEHKGEGGGPLQVIINKPGGS